jgi:hypothetical protein
LLGFFGDLKYGACVSGGRAPALRALVSVRAENPLFTMR